MVKMVKKPKKKPHCWISQVTSTVRVSGPDLNAHLRLSEGLWVAQELPKRESSQPKADV